MFAHVLYCLDEIEAELENLTSSTSGTELAADLSNHISAMRRLVALAAEMSGTADAASGTGAFLLSAEDDLAIAIHEEAPAGEATTFEVDSCVTDEIETEETAAGEATTLEVDSCVTDEIETEETAAGEATTLEADSCVTDEIETEETAAGEIEAEEPCPAVLEVVDQLIAEASTDELTLIRGIDADLAQELTGQGVTRFATIASWTVADIAAIASVASQERIAKENWIEQAALLAAGTMTTFATAAVAAKTLEEAADLQMSDAAPDTDAGSLVEPATNVISLATHKLLAEGLVSRLPAKAAPAAKTPEAVVIPFKAAQAARSASSSRWMLRIAACLALAACAGLASLQSPSSSTSITWVIGAL